jgi:hypothetical protein
MNKSVAIVETSFTNLHEICLEILELEFGSPEESIFLERIKCVSSANMIKQSTLSGPSSLTTSEVRQTSRTEEGQQRVGLKKTKRKEVAVEKNILQSYESSYISECVSHLKNQYAFLLQHFFQESYQLVDYLVYSQPSAAYTPSALPLPSSSVPPSVHTLPLSSSSSSSSAVEPRLSSSPFSPSRQQLKEYLSFHIQQVFFCSIFDIQNECLLNIPTLSSLDDSSPLVLSLSLGKQFTVTWHQQLHDYFVRLTSPLEDEEEKGVLNEKEGNNDEGKMNKEGDRCETNDNDKDSEDGDNASEACSSTASSSSSSTSNVRKNFAYNPYEEWEGLISFDEIEIIHRPASSNQTFQSLTCSSLYSFPYLRLTINKEIPVLLHTSSLLSLSFYSFVEEISDFVGKNQLLKRSFLLCQYFLEIQLSYLYDREDVSKDVTNDEEEDEEGETGGSRKKKEKLIFSEEVLWIMILSVFNRYLPSLDSPLQALMLLLLEMCCYDPKKHIVTIFGIFDIIDPSHLLPSSSSSPIPCYPPTPIPFSSASRHPLATSSTATAPMVLASSEFLPFQRTVTVSTADFAFSSSILSKYQTLLNPPTKDEILKKESDLKQLEKEKKAALKVMGKKKAGGMSGGSLYNQQQQQYRPHQGGSYPLSSHGGASSSSPLSHLSSSSSSYSFTFLIPSFYADHLQRASSSKEEKNNRKRNADTNFFLALHPLNHTILQTNPSHLRSINTTDGKIVEVFHFGLLYFIQLYEGIRELVQNNSLLSAGNSSSTRMMSSSEKNLQLLKETLVPSSLPFSMNFPLASSKASVYR